MNMERAEKSKGSQGHARGCRKPFEGSPLEGLESTKVWHMSLKSPGNDLRLLYRPAPVACFAPHG